MRLLVELSLPATLDTSDFSSARCCLNPSLPSFNKKDIFISEALSVISFMSVRYSC